MSGRYAVRNHWSPFCCLGMATSYFRWTVRSRMVWCSGQYSDFLRLQLSNPDFLLPPVPVVAPPAVLLPSSGLPESVRSLHFVPESLPHMLLQQSVHLSDHPQHHSVPLFLPTLRLQLPVFPPAPSPVGIAVKHNRSPVSFACPQWSPACSDIPLTFYGHIVKSV